MRLLMLLRYFILLSFVFTYIVPLLRRLNPRISRVIDVFHMHFVAGYVLLFVFGVMLTDISHIRRMRLICAGIIVLSLVRISYFETKKNGELYQPFYDILAPLLVIMAAAVFLFFRDITISGKAARTAIRTLFGVGMGIYMVHPLIMSICGNVFDGGGWLCIPKIVLVYLLSAGVSLALSLHPVTGRLFLKS